MKVQSCFGPQSHTHCIKVKHLLVIIVQISARKCLKLSQSFVCTSLSCHQHYTSQDPLLSTPELTLSSTTCTSSSSSVSLVFTSLCLIPSCIYSPSFSQSLSVNVNVTLCLRPSTCILLCSSVSKSYINWKTGLSLILCLHHTVTEMT